MSTRRALPFVSVLALSAGCASTLVLGEGVEPDDDGVGGAGSAGAPALGDGGGPLGELPDATGARFDGVDDRVVVPDNTSYDLGGGDFTILVRARVDVESAGGVVPFVSRRLTERDGFLFIGYYGTLLLQMNGVPNFVVKGRVAELGDGCPHVFAVTRKNGELTFYVDGRPSPAYMDRMWEAPALSTRSINADLPISIGFDPPTGLAFAGEIAQVSFWARATDAREFDEGLRRTKLVGHWGFGDVSGQAVADLSATGNTAFLGSDPLRPDARDPLPATAELGCAPSE